MRELIADLPVAPRAAGDSGRYLHLLSARRLLGCVGGRMGVHLAELRDRCGIGRSLRLFRRSPTSNRNLLWREPCGDRSDPSLLLPAGQAWHGRLDPVGDRGGMPCRHGDPSGRGGAVVRRRRNHRNSVLWAVQTSAEAGAANRSRARGCPACAGRIGIDVRQASSVLPQGRFAHVRQRIGDRPVPRAGAGPAVWMARPTPVPHRCCGRNDQSGARGDHGYLRRLSRGGVLGLACLHGWNLSPRPSSWCWSRHRCSPSIGKIPTSKVS